MTRAWLTSIVLAGLLSLTLAGTTAARTAACTRFAATSGSDSAPGSEAEPFRSAQRLADSLGSGETGCLRGGVFTGNVTVSSSGSPGAPITLTSYPGERATIAGKLWIGDSANFVTVAALNLDGRNAAALPSPAVNGDDVAFVDNDVTNQHTATCFILGPTTYGRAHRTLIARNRIHGCGELPATNFDHGIYVEHATGARVVDNVISANADRGVQLYPDAQQSYVAGNVIDGNGVGVLIAGGEEESGPQASSENVIEHNLITNSTQRHNVESHWGSPLVGDRNVVRNNCIWGGVLDADNHGLAPARGFVATQNVLADPLYRNPAAGDFGLRPDSPCRDLAGYRTDAVGQRTRIVLHAPKSMLRPGRPVRLAGHVTGIERPQRVRLRTRSGKGWKRLATIRVRRDGRFATRLRLRVRRAHGRSGRRRFVLRRVHLSRRTRALKVFASARGVGRSNVVRLAVATRRR